MCKKEEECTGGKNRVFEEKFGKEIGEGADKSGAVRKKKKFVFYETKATLLLYTSKYYSSANALKDIACAFEGIFVHSLSHV